MRVRSSLFFAGSALLVFSTRAQAGNDDELFVGNRAALAGGAVSAVVEDSSATWYNPAGLGNITRSQVDVSATAYTLRLYSSPHLLSTTGGGSKNAAVTEFVSVPTQIAYVRQLAPGVSLGLGYFVPHASNFVLRVGLNRGSADNGSQSQIAATVADMQHTAAAAVGLALSPHLRVGFSLVGGYAATTQAVSIFSAVQRGGQTRGLLSNTLIGTGSRVSMEAGAGMQLELSRHFTLGISARSPRVLLYDGVAASESAGSATTGDMDQTTVAGTAFEPKSNTDKIRLLRAGRVGAGLAYRYPSGWISAELDVQPSLTAAEFDVRRKTLANGRIGIYHVILPTVAIGAGLFTDRSADRARDELLSSSGDFYGGTIGIELSNEHLLDASETVESLIFTTVFALRYAFSDSDLGRAVVDEAGVISGTEPFRTEPGKLRVHEIGFYAGSGLHF